MNITYHDDNAAALRTLLDRAAITQVVQDWGLARDTGRWEQLLSFHTPGATVQTNWFVGSAAEFVERSRKAFEGGAQITPDLPVPGSAALERLYAQGGLAVRRSVQARQVILFAFRLKLRTNNATQTPHLDLQHSSWPRRSQHRALGPRSRPGAGQVRRATRGPCQLLLCRYMTSPSIRACSVTSTHTRDAGARR